MTYLDVLSIFSGALTTLLLSAAGIMLGLPIGLGMALVRWLRVPVVASLVATLVSLLRAAPLITLLLLLFYGLPNLGIEVGPVFAGVLAITLNTSAFNCEIWRAALVTFPKDQLEAAQSVGMSRGLWLRRIVFPQIVRTSLPALVNEMSQLIKVTPVLAVVGIVDITRAAVRIGADTYDPLPPLLVAAAIYIPMVFALVSMQRWVERRQIRLETNP
ncbi:MULTISPECIES: amino acid ABC transporter permease [Paraburkholderia]|uniref:Amino acid ABC transporter permease n=1 Tax=Paraburkholderia metrosideri TaxID=580937 RepID=A0ABW9E6Y7_9BURK